MPCREPCLVDRRLRDRSGECVCERLARAILTGDRTVLASIPGEAVQRALKRTEESERREGSG